MKKIVLFGAAAAALLATPALAQQDGGGMDGGAGVTRAQVQARVQQAFARVDVNRDGFVTQQEAQSVRGTVRGEPRGNRGQAREARFAQLDANRDGESAVPSSSLRVPRPELAQRREMRAERRAQRVERRGQRGTVAHVRTAWRQPLRPGGSKQ
jgi:hypothetical protein